MRRLLWLIPFLCLLYKPASATWTCADGGVGCTVTTTRSCAGTSCVITVGSTTAGSVEVACGQVPGTTTTLTVTGDGSWATAANSYGTDSTAGRAMCAYNLNATGGATSITCTFSPTNSANQCMYLRFTGTLGSNTFDKANNADDTTCTSCAGVALTLGTSNNYILVQTVGCSATCSAINQSYDGKFLNGDGMAYKINVSAAGTTPNWTSTSGTVAAGGIAIYEGSGAAVTRHRAQVIQKP